ncbi:GNAT family N-acetyltransferase [Staphylococcus haemolyticus]|uniref:GNAT family N-acetyltransferase n=1 Tax=Staphylococcus haemolyticus TaxID=1283 RepID=A0AB38PCC3_STAHA|nr:MULTISPECIES: GNAT family N-acetyltransferase [Staphylococcus]MCE4963887.1 GNAT family N-acetyltransferase [Staphylococcus haemolyticus]MCE4988009.1 GNAT family N-acetyltransferase [Staphylococcus haemolyticus]MCE4992245.1 GNAT family N-acetyltransferase [Staphylococcus haemolyticus]MCE5036526.1 GNAT family N-acetyltransferase [Staphylococcus haemolyticus]MCE5050709.1 GNAT family N-acetyltransferase [Staphylococcus haemolyticus]
MIEHLKKKNRKTIKVLGNIWLNANLDTHTFIDSFYWIDNYSNVLDSLKDADVYVYKENEQIVAFCGLIDNYIAGLFVKEEYRNKGIGHALIKHLQSEYDHLSLEVFEQNNRAVHFYESLGFIKMESSVDKTNHTQSLMQWKK